MRLQVTYETPDGVVTEVLGNAHMISPANGFLYVLDEGGGFVWGAPLDRVIDTRRLHDGVAPGTDTQQ